MDDTNDKEKGTTVLLESDSYSLILNKQTEIFNETKKRISIQKLVSEAVKKGITQIIF